MIGLSFLLCLLTGDNNDNPIITWRHIVFTDWRQRQPNHNTTTYCVYWRTKRTTTQSKHDLILCLLTEDNDNPIIIRPHIRLGCGSCRPSVNTICDRVMIGLSLLSSVSKHNIWSYCDWVVVVFRNNDNPIITRPHIVFTDGRQQRQPNHNTTTYCVYWRKTTTTQS
jgi:hypothetical protein